MAAARRSKGSPVAGRNPSESGGTTAATPRPLVVSPSEDGLIEIKAIRLRKRDVFGPSLVLAHETDYRGDVILARWARPERFGWFCWAVGIAKLVDCEPRRVGPDDIPLFTYRFEEPIHLREKLLGIQFPADKKVRVIDYRCDEAWLLAIAFDPDLLSEPEEGADGI